MSMCGATLAVVLGASITPGVPPPMAQPAPRIMRVPESQMPRTGQDTLSFRVPVYPRATTPVVRVGDTLEAHGLPMNVQSFYTNDPPPRVLDWYKAFFTQWQLPMLGNGDLSVRFSHPSLSVFDEINGVDIHVICVPGDVNGKTMVLLAMADIRTFETNQGEVADAQQWGGLPKYPGAQDPNAVASSDGEVRTVSVSFSTGDSPSQVIERYSSTFEQLGFVQQPSQHVDDPRLKAMDFAHGPGVWHLAAASTPEKGTSKNTTVFATWTSRPEVNP